MRQQRTHRLRLSSGRFATSLRAAALLLFSALAQITAEAASTALADYVYTPDPAFSFTLVDTVPGAGYTAYVLLMDSLSWRTAEEVDRSLWTHQVVVLVPEEVTSSTALLLVNGGSDAFAPIDPLVLELGAPLAILTGSVLAAVSQIPNQPLQFADEPAPISEDALVAYSWDKAMLSGDPAWAAYLPMTKASVRAMDAVQGFVDEALAGVQIDEFVVTGFSKRGATAWLVAAVDPRVRAVAPGVFDILDMPLQIERHYEAYGFYAPAIVDYVNYDIVTRTRSPEGRFLVDIVDPLSYADALVMPKLILIATGDQFFLPDSANFYLDRLPGETLVRQVANTDHGFTGAEVAAVFDLLAWYETVLTDTPRPQLSWSFDADGTLVVVADTVPLAATLWQATNPDARDFRLDTLGPAWSDTALAAQPDGSFQVQVPAPQSGYTGYLVTLTFPGETVPQNYGTPVFVTPEELPFVLEDPLLEPRRAPYWRCQIEGEAGCGVPPDYTPGELEALLPFTVFGEYQRDLEMLRAKLRVTDDPVGRAQRACAVSRLNIAAGEQGWHSALDLGALGSGPLWSFYAQAEAAFAGGDAMGAARLCTRINAVNLR